MTLSALVPQTTRPPLLAPDEPPPFTRIGCDSARPIVLLADHASNRIPRSLDDLGVDEEPRQRHIAYDIGIAEVAQGVAARLDIPLLMHNYSRLVIDPNRPLDDPTSIPVISDGVIIPGNRGLSPESVAERVDTLFHPYQTAVGEQLVRAGTSVEAPALISLHSFTPSLRGFPRPWHVGLLWSDDDRMSRPMIERLGQMGDLVVGDNQPYSGQCRYGYTVETHALSTGLPNVLVEIRQDLIGTPAGVAEWIDRLVTVLEPSLADPALYRRMPGP